jgi:hypothetical protein
MRSESVCPQCGEPIILQQSGWWVHDGLPGDCWRLSMDGPGADGAQSRYERRVRELEADGLSTSDAQSVADVEWERGIL